ncbi:hypothetical protein V6Z11_D05G160600 [Gossypium hirsutum]
MCSVSDHHLLLLSPLQFSLDLWEISVYTGLHD